MEDRYELLDDILNIIEDEEEDETTEALED